MILAAIQAIKKLGIKTNYRNKVYTIYGKGIDGYNYKKKLVINAKIWDIR